MPIYNFECKECSEKYELMTKYDKSGKYKDVICPYCKSKNKKKLVSSFAFAFANPVGTDKWNNSSTGHDYRFKHNIPNVKKERETAEALSHMGPTPYQDTSEADFQLGTGIHDAKSRSGLT